MANDAGFFGQFIDDYFAECDEHLVTARRALLALEAGAGGAAPDPARLRELHRSLHTLKGLAGMVGDSCAERIAHALEESLRSALRTDAPFTAEFVDGLFSSVDALERCVSARRSDRPAPDVTAVLAALARVTPTVGASLVDPATPAVATPEADGGSASHAPAGPLSPVSATVPGAIVRFEFIPSLALGERGVGVDAIRARLGSLGTILDARPRMVGGGVAFDFRVAMHAGAAPDAAWTGDGLTWHAEESSQADAPSASEREPAGQSAPHPAASSPAPSVAAPSAGAGVVRVDLARLDAVMRLVGDLVVTRSRLDDVVKQLASGSTRAAQDALEETSSAMERQLRQLRERVVRIRLVQVGEVFERLRFTARDAIRESGKRVSLAFSGQTTEIDKLVVDGMLEPLLHLVRNAVSHGIESPADRLASGKPEEGTLTLRAMASGDRIILDVEDDGAGIDVERVAARARDRGLLGPDEPLLADRLIEMLCAPGLSTRDEADLTSGRGIGMDVVRAAVHALGGELTVRTVTGRGTRFVIDLPLTLMIVDALLVDVSGQQMAVPQPALREVLQVESASIVRFENNDVVAYRGGVLPVVRLSRLFGLADVVRPNAYLLVVGTEAAPMGLLVDRLVELREIVVHPVTDPLVTVPGVAGATELGDGRVSLILDAGALLRLAQEQRDERARSRFAARPHLPAAPRAGRAPHLPS